MHTGHRPDGFIFAFLIHPTVKESVMSAVENLTEVVDANAPAKAKTRTAGTSSVAFKQMLDNIINRQKQTTSLLDYYEQMQSERDNTLSAITGRLQRFFLPEEKLSQKMLFTSEWFSTSTGAQQNFLSGFDSLSQSTPSTAASAMRSLVSFFDRFSSALTNTADQSAVITSSLTSFSFNSAIFQNQLNTANSSTTIHSLSMEFKMKQVEAHSVESVEDSELLENGGSMIEVEGRYINFQVYMKVMDPVVLDLAGDGINLKSVSDGVIFDLAGNGKDVRCGFVQGDDALLFLDEDGDGVCSNGNELFGDQQGHANGFAELSEYDINSDGEIDDKDNVYSNLKVWNDNNGDGKCQGDEVRSLKDAGVETLSLGYCDTNEENNGNFISQKSFFRRFSGELGVIADANFAYREK